MIFLTTKKVDSHTPISLNPKTFAKGFIEMQASQGSGKLYEDFYRNRPDFGKVKLKQFAKEFT